jgi:hypothetical protein
VKPTKKIQVRRSILALHPEYKIKDVHLATILDFGQRWFSKGNLPLLKPNPQKNFSLIHQSVLQLSDGN